jgi:hypothetical protein
MVAHPPHWQDRRRLVAQRVRQRSEHQHFFALNAMCHHLVVEAVVELNLVLEPVPKTRQLRLHALLHCLVLEPVLHERRRRPEPTSLHLRRQNCRRRVLN